MRHLSNQYKVSQHDVAPKHSIQHKSFASAPKRRATSHLEQPPEKLDNEGAASARSTSDANQKQPAPLRKSQSGVATLGRLRVVTTSPPQGTATVDSPEQERPRRRQPSAARSRTTRDTSLTQFAVMDDENVSQQVRALREQVALGCDRYSWLSVARGGVVVFRWRIGGMDEEYLSDLGGVVEMNKEDVVVGGCFCWIAEGVQWFWFAGHRRTVCSVLKGDGKVRDTNYVHLFYC